MKTLLELSLIMALCLLGDLIASLIPFPIPGTILALCILFILLKTKVIMEDGIILLVGIVMKSKISITSREIEAEVGVIVVIERQSQIQTGIRKRMLIGMDSQAMSLKAHGN